MGMSSGGGPGAVKADINVTPLVDVVLVLLIIFMVITPMLQRGKDVHLPKASKPKNEIKSDVKQDPLILSVTPDKKMYLDKDMYDDENLEKALKREFELAPGRKVLLKGDETLSFVDIRTAMNIARKAGAKGIALGVEEEKK
jgi:biopolymer transport protein TolR